MSMDAEKSVGEETLEETLEQVEEIIRQMEESQVSLDTSFRLYQQGIEKLKHCNQMLDAVEKKMLILGQNGELSEF